MSKFLNDFAANMNQATPATLEKLETAFRQTIKLIDEALDGRAFRPVRSLNAAVFDSVMVGLATRLETQPPPGPSIVKAAYEKLLENQDYKRFWERATADEESVKRRLEMAVQSFAGLQ